MPPGVNVTFFAIQTQWKQVSGIDKWKQVHYFIIIYDWFSSKSMNKVRECPEGNPCSEKQKSNLRFEMCMGLYIKSNVGLYDVTVHRQNFTTYVVKI